MKASVEKALTLLRLAVVIDLVNDLHPLRHVVPRKHFFKISEDSELLENFEKNVCSILLVVLWVRTPHSRKRMSKKDLK